MAKGYEQHQNRLRALSLFGKELARRSHSSCELCEASGVKLLIFEVGPIPAEPEYENCIFICHICQKEGKNPKKMNPHHWRCLYGTVWSEVPAVQVMAVRLLRRLAPSEAWAAELLEQLYLEEEVQQWIDQE